MSLSNGNDSFGVLVLSVVKHDYIARGVALHPRFELTVVADDADRPDWVHERNERFANQHGIPYVRDVAKAIAEYEGSVDLLLPHVLQQTRMRMTDNGSFIAEVVDREGSPRIGDSQGNPMTIPQLVEEMKSSDSFARAFNSSGATGSGATNNTSQNTGGTGRSRSISRFDQDALNANIEQLASGEVTISD
jgi:hypothetical protein